MLLMRERPANRRLVKDGRLREGPRWAGPLLRLRPLRPLIGKPLRLRAGAPLLEGPLLLGSLLEQPLEGRLLGWGLLGGRVLDGGRRRMGPLGLGVGRRVSGGSLCPEPAVLGPRSAPRILSSPVDQPLNAPPAIADHPDLINHFRGKTSEMTGKST
jgi:hypothetical protein